VLRLVLDTNVLISSLISKNSLSFLLYQAWDKGDYTLITSYEQLDEVTRVLRYPKLAHYFSSEEADIFVEGLRRTATITQNLPAVSASPDPGDNVILATALAGYADYLVSGDKRDILFLKTIETVKIVSVREAAALFATS
jgi:putative PIN family toxin of toxin-antitoxin system